MWSGWARNHLMPWSSARGSGRAPRGMGRQGVTRLRRVCKEYTIGARAAVDREGLAWPGELCGRRLFPRAKEMMDIADPEHNVRLWGQFELAGWLGASRRGFISILSQCHHRLTTR